MAEPTAPADSGPFFHGTRAALAVGELLSAGHRSNYRPEIIMNHVYFTALRDGAALAAQISALTADASLLAAGADSWELSAAQRAAIVHGAHVYQVEPTGPFEDDPNVTDKKFPGNPTRSYRTQHPLRIVSEITDWTPLSAEVLADWRRRLAGIRESGGEILN